MNHHIRNQCWRCWLEELQTYSKCFYSLNAISPPVCLRKKPPQQCFIAFNMVWVFSLSQDKLGLIPEAGEGPWYLSCYLVNWTTIQSWSRMPQTLEALVETEIIPPASTPSVLGLRSSDTHAGLSESYWDPVHTIARRGHGSCLFIFFIVG